MKDRYNISCHSSGASILRTSFHDGNAIVSSTSSGVSENTQTFTHTNRTAHVGSNLLHSQDCFAMMKRDICPRALVDCVEEAVLNNGNTNRQKCYCGCPNIRERFVVKSSPR